MGDINNAGGDEEIIETEEGADNQDESLKDGGAGDEGKGTDKPDDDNGDKKPDEADKGDKKPESKPTPNADEEPKTRKRNIDFILERKNEKIKKLQDKTNGADADKGDEDEDDLDPNDAQIIQKHVAKALSPFLAKQMQDEDSQEIGDFVKQNPDFAPYMAKVQKFAQHPSRKDMPIASIFYEVAGTDLLKLGADRARKADIESKKSRAGGGNSNGGGSEKGVWDLSPEEFEAQKDSVRTKVRE
jgi:hypothetical protein